MLSNGAHADRHGPCRVRVNADANIIFFGHPRDSIVGNCVIIKGQRNNPSDGISGKEEDVVDHHASFGRDTKRTSSTSSAGTFMCCFCKFRYVGIDPKLYSNAHDVR